MQRGSSRRGEASQGSRVQALLERRDSVSSWNRRGRRRWIGGLECFRRGRPGGSAGGEARDGEAGAAQGAAVRM